MSSDQRSASEKALEDIFARYPDITESILGYNSGSLTLLDRQQSVAVGRTDLIFLAGDELILIELKAKRATRDNVQQLERYRDHYEQYVLGDRYPATVDLVPILLAPEIPTDIQTLCDSQNLQSVEFDIDEVLTGFENRLFSGHGMFEQEPVGTSVAKLQYINGLLRYLGDVGKPQTREDCIDNLDEIAIQPTWSKPKSRMGQFIRLGIRLNLIYRVGKSQPLWRKGDLRVSKDDELLLTERGVAYYSAMMDSPQRVPSVNVDQANLITELLYERPFYSKVTSGMVIFLDTVYDLSQASNRVNSTDLEQWFPKKAGRAWSGKSPSSIVTWYGNYLDELGLIVKVTQSEGSDGDRDFHYITPEGMRLLSNLHIEVGKVLIQQQK